MSTQVKKDKNKKIGTLDTSDTNPTELTQVPSAEDFQKMVAARYKEEQKKQSLDVFFPPKLIEQAKERESDVIANIFHDKTGKLPTSIFDYPPDFTNAEGTKWWLNNFVSEWAWKKNLHGVSLPHIGAWQVETGAGERSILLVDHESGSILREYTTLENTAYGIDMFKIVKHFDDNGK